MHSRIFQASLKPIDKIEYIEESNYWDHWFVGSVADYVTESDDRDEDIQWLKDCHSHHGLEFGKDDNGEFFIVKDKCAYFERSFDVFKETLDKIKDCTLEDFAQGFHEMWQLKNAYEDKFDFYIDADGELLSLDSFIRLCATEEKYYIGGTLDFHC